MLNSNVPTDESVGHHALIHASGFAKTLHVGQLPKQLGVGDF